MKHGTMAGTAAKEKARKVDNQSREKKPYTSPKIKFEFSSKQLSEAIDKFNEAMEAYVKASVEAITPIVEAYNQWAVTTGAFFAEFSKKCMEAFEKAEQSFGDAFDGLNSSSSDTNSDYKGKDSQ